MCSRPDGRQRPRQPHGGRLARHRAGRRHGSSGSPAAQTRQADPTGGMPTTATITAVVDASAEPAASHLRSHGAASRADSGWVAIPGSRNGCLLGSPVSIASPFATSGAPACVPPSSRSPAPSSAKLRPDGFVRDSQPGVRETGSRPRGPSAADGPTLRITTLRRKQDRLSQGLERLSQKSFCAVVANRDGPVIESFVTCLLQDAAWLRF